MNSRIRLHLTSRWLAVVVRGLLLLLAGAAAAQAQAPSITSISSPRQIVNRGQSLTLTVSASGTPAPSIQWRRNGRAVAGATSPTFTITNASFPRDTGWYQAVATNTNGSATSAPVFVNVAMSPAQIVPYGAIEDGLTAVPAGLTNLIGITTGAFHSAALRTDGTVVVWGSTLSGQGAIPSGLNNVVALSAGNAHTLALRSTGTVAAWGSGPITVPGTLANVVAISAGYDHNLAVRADGTVVAWGSNSVGQAAVPSGLTNVVAVAAGFQYSLALRENGTVASWGVNNFGVTAVPAGLSNVVAIAAGSTHAVALRADGTVVAWGSSQGERLAVPGGLSAIAIAAADFHSLALRSDGTVVGWGSNFDGQRASPPGLNNVVAIAAGGRHSLALRDATSGNLVLSPIVQNPQSDGVNAGEAITFDVVALGAPTYQWQKGTDPIPGATNASLTIQQTIPSDAGPYSVVVTTGGVSFTSAVANLTVNIPPGYPQIVIHPVGITVNAGAPATFVVLVTGNATTPVAYQWRKGGTSVPGATSATFTIPNATANDAGSYTARVSNTVGFDISNAATLTVNAPPAILTQPVGATVTAGSTVTLSVVASGSPPPSYQWRRNTTALPGATNATLVLSSVTAANAGNYDVVVTNTAGTVTSNAATLNVTPAPTAPVITQQPVSQNVTAGANVTLTVAASGTPAPVYQWRKDGANLAGATAATLAIPDARITDSGAYTVLVSNSIGAVTSSVATLVVTTPDTGRLINLSILTSISAVNPLFTVGTVIGGAGTSGSKELLIRAAGPSLTQFNVTGELSDPTMNVFSGQTVIASNDNWGGSQALRDVFAQVGAFPYLASTSRDAALFNPSIPAGPYTIQITGVGGATGTVIAEIYDATPPSALASTKPRLINIAVRQRIDAGTLLTAGFVIGGSTPRRVLVRAIGPTLGLQPFNVPDVMSDPQIALFDGTARIIAVNNNWGGTAQLEATFAAVGAFPLPVTSLDAALVVTLDPGNYTAQVSGVGLSAGTALVEVYEVP